MSPATVVLAALLLGAAAASAAVPARKLAQAVAPSIVHGKDSPRVGWYVSLGQQDDDTGAWSSICGGMLITQTTVLTAAHCVFTRQGVFNPPTTVAIGIRDVATDKPDVDYDLATVIDVVVHPRYLSAITSQGHDIALLQLDPDTVTGKNELVALPLFVPKPSNPLAAGTRLQLVGLGDLGNGTDATVLQRTEVVLEPLQVCNEAWPTNAISPSFFESTFICAGAPRNNKFTDACPGDSGGPLYVPRTAGRPYDTIIGLVSYGVQCGALYNKTSYGKPGVYTNVVQMKRWIKANLACLAKGRLCPWDGTCFDNPSDGCATCHPKAPWACGTCTVPGYDVNSAGQCRPADCLTMDENCIACARRRRNECAVCTWGYTVDNGKCVPKTCLDYDRGCQQCDPASPLTCTACKRGHALDTATGKCVRVHQAHP